MTSSAGDVQQLSFGESLRRERELRRIDLRDVSEATKINIRYLEALERNEFTYLPAGAFTRGFIRSYARFIGTDESDMINAYLYEIGRQERVDPRKGSARDASRDGHRGALRAVQPRSKAHRSRVIVVVSVVAALILAAAAMVLVPRLLERRAAAEPSTGPASGSSFEGPPSVPRG